MKLNRRTAASGVIVSACAVCLSGCGPQDMPAPDMDAQGRIERGRYLTTQVAMCIDCHTPRNERGEFVTERWLQGAELDFEPRHPMPWAPFAPPIAGLSVYGHDHIVTLLTTGARPDGTRCDPPMPPYRMTREDAEAVAAYLESLGR